MLGVEIHVCFRSCVCVCVCVCPFRHLFIPSLTLFSILCPEISELYIYIDIFLIFIYLFIWLHQVLVAAGRVLRCGIRTLSCGMHVGSSSLSRERTRAPCVGSTLRHQGSPSYIFLIYVKSFIKERVYAETLVATSLTS